jgi:hypothetical protein
MLPPVPDVPPSPLASAGPLPWPSVVRMGVGAGLLSHLPWLLASRSERFRPFSVFMISVFLLFDPWLTVPLVRRLRGFETPGWRARGAIVGRALAAGLLSGTIAGLTIVVWERYRIGAWMAWSELAGHVVYPLLAGLYAATAAAVVLLRNHRPAVRA